MRVVLVFLLFLVSCAPSIAIRGPVDAPVSTYRSPDFLCMDHRPLVAILIDDIGRKPHDMDPFLKLPIPVSFSVFPGLPFSKRAIERASSSGREAWGHIPMEPVLASVMEPDLTFLLVKDSPGIIRDKLRRMLDSLPGIKGVNNHMGSAFTAQAGLMRVVLDELKSRGLYFLDSRTTRFTAAEKTARLMGFPGLRRDVFLDDVSDPAYVEKSMDKLVKKALKQGCALAIGHPFPETAEGITRWLRSYSRSVRFVYVSDLVSCSRFANANCRDNP